MNKINILRILQDRAHQNEMTYTVAELEHAICWAFPVYGTGQIVLKNCGRVVALRMAIEYAFLDALTGPNTDILRQASRNLSNGQFKPLDPDNL